MKIWIDEWIIRSVGSGTPSDPPEIPENEPEGIPVEPPETIPEPDKAPFSPDEPEQIPPLPMPEQPSPGPANPGQPAMHGVTLLSIGTGITSALQQAWQTCAVGDGHSDGSCVYFFQIEASPPIGDALAVSTFRQSNVI